MTARTPGPDEVPTLGPETVYITPPSVARDRTILLAIIGPKGGQSERGTVYLSALDARTLASRLLRAAEAREDGQR